LTERVGFSGSVVWYDKAEQLAWLRRLRDTGAGWIREDFHWGAFEVRPGVWTWSVGDRLMRNAAIAGVDVLGVVSYSAGWAASGPTIYHPPSNPALYAEFCRRLVERYGSGGSFWQANPELQPRPLRALEIWNEPWHHYFWRPNPDPAAYVRLVRAAATAIQQADPAVKVLASADIFQMRAGTTESRDWFRLLLDIDPGLFRKLVDAYSVHAYSQRRGPDDTSVAQRWRYDRVLLTRDLAARAGAAHPLWITELGWTTAASHRDSVSETTQALYLRRALERAVGEWGSFVERAFIYHWGRVESDNVGGFGFFRADGDAKPAVHKLRSLLRAPRPVSR
jgi:polysaccharide biosynthesis protein PslG